MAAATDLKSVISNDVWVRVPPRVPNLSKVSITGSTDRLIICVP